MDDLGFLDQMLRQVFGTLQQYLDTDSNGRISESEIASTADLFPRYRFPMDADLQMSSFDTNSDGQVTYEEVKSRSEEIAPMIIEELDRNADRAISADEFKGAGWLLVREAIRIVDQGSNSIDKIWLEKHLEIPF